MILIIILITILITISLVIIIWITISLVIIDSASLASSLLLNGLTRTATFTPLICKYHVDVDHDEDDDVDVDVDVAVDDFKTSFHQGLL